ncbi:MAG: DNA polymerase III subunit delta [Candidatus Sericytochromatia bacterium]
MPKNNIYLVYGDDLYAIDEFEKKFISENVDPQWETFNLDILDASSISIDRIVESADSPPFGFGNKVTIIKKSENVFNQNEDNLKILLNLLNKGLMETNFLIFVAESLDKRKTFIKSLIAISETKELNQLKSWELSTKLKPWVEDCFRKKGKRIDYEASKELIEATSGNKHRIEREIEKLVIYVGDEPIITYKDVRLLVPNNESDLFELLNFMAKKEVGNILKELASILLKENPIKLIASLAANLKTIYSIKLLIEDEMGINDISKALGQKPFIVEKNSKTWKNFSSKKLREIIKDLMDIDLKFKSVSVNHKLELEKFIVKNFS